MAGYQVMPRMSPERYESLELDIIENGVQVPILVAQDGTIIDGHHRDEIARKHDLHCPRTTVEGDEVKLRSLAYSLNANRRDLSREQRDEMLNDSLRKDPILRDSEHARRTGFSKPTVKKRRESLGLPTPDDLIIEHADSHPEKSNREVARELGVDHKTVGAVRGGEKVKPLQNPQPTSIHRIDNSTVIGIKDLAPVPDPTPPAEPEPVLSFDDEPDDGTPEWEEVAHIPPARLKDLSRSTAVNIPQKELDELNAAPGTPPPEAPPKVHKPLDEEYHNPKEHFIDLMSHLKKASKAIEDAIFTAKHIDSWDGGPLSGDLRELLDQLDAALDGGSFDAELARLIEGEK